MFAGGEQCWVVFHVAFEQGSMEGRESFRGVGHVNRVVGFFWECVHHSEWTIPARKKFGNTIFVPRFVFPMTVQGGQHHLIIYHVDIFGTAPFVSMVALVHFRCQ